MSQPLVDVFGNSTTAEQFLQQNITEQLPASVQQQFLSQLGIPLSDISCSFSANYQHPKMAVQQLLENNFLQQAGTFCHLEKALSSESVQKSSLIKPMILRAQEFILPQFFEGKVLIVCMHKMCVPVIYAVFEL